MLLLFSIFFHIKRLLIPMSAAKHRFIKPKKPGKESQNSISINLTEEKKVK